MTILREYLENCREVMLAEYDRSSKAGSHGGDLGENREQLIVDFLNQNQPRSLYAQRGGQVIGVNQESSQQIDVIISHDYSIEFRAHEKSYRIAEAVIGVIAVKSNLTSSALKADFKNISSVPEPSPEAFSIAHLGGENLIDAYRNSYPARMIIGFEGATADTLIDALHELRNENQDIIFKFPEVIMVLRHGYSLRLLGKKEYIAGRIPFNQVRWEKVIPKNGPAWGLVWLLNELSAASTWTSSMTVRLNPYW